MHQVAEKIKSEEESRYKKLLKAGLQIFLQDFLRLSVVAITIIYAKGSVGDAVFLSVSITVALISSAALLYVNYSRKASTHKVKLALAKLKNQETENNSSAQTKERIFYLESSAKLLSAVGAVVASFLYKKGILKEWDHYLLSLLLLLLGSIATGTMAYDRQENYEDVCELLQITTRRNDGNTEKTSEHKRRSKSSKSLWAIAFVATFVALNATSNALGIFYASGKIDDAVFLSVSFVISTVFGLIFLHNTNERRKTTRKVKESVQLLSNQPKTEQKLFWIHVVEISSRVFYTALSVAAPFLYKKDIIGPLPYYFLLIFSMAFGAVLECTGSYDRLEMSKESDKLLHISDVNLIDQNKQRS